MANFFVVAGFSGSIDGNGRMLTELKHCEWLREQSLRLNAVPGCKCLLTSEVCRANVSSYAPSFVFLQFDTRFTLRQREKSCALPYEGLEL